MQAPLPGIAPFAHVPLVEVGVGVGDGLDSMQAPETHDMLFATQSNPPSAHFVLVTVVPLYVVAQ